MNRSREYLKKLSVPQRIALAKKVGVRQEYLYQISVGLRSPSRALVARLERATNRKVKASDFDKETLNSLSAGA